MSEHCNCSHAHDHHDYSSARGNGHDHGHRHGHGIHAEAFAESALRKSMRRAIFLDAPTSAKAVAAQKMAALSEIAERVAFEDIILGHIKALIDFSGRKVSISITRLDECSRSFDDWDDFEASNYILTVNILSLHNTDAELDGLMEKLFEDTADCTN